MVAGCPIALFILSVPQGCGMASVYEQFNQTHTRRSSQDYLADPGVVCIWPFPFSNRIRSQSHYYLYFCITLYFAHYDPTAELWGTWYLATGVYRGDLLWVEVMNVNPDGGVRGTRLVLSGAEGSSGFHRDLTLDLIAGYP